jgi:hypothetical protein
MTSVRPEPPKLVINFSPAITRFMLPVALKAVALKSRLAALSKKRRFLLVLVKKTPPCRASAYGGFSNGRQQASVAPM